jgi:hypothetical protein
MGDRMVVRAVRPVAAGEELLINYLGRSNLRPVRGWAAVALRGLRGLRAACGPPQPLRRGDAAAPMAGPPGRWPGWCC